MRICLFSDIHGNGPAFFAALEQILKEGADRQVFLGDLCGYYYDQLEILAGLGRMPNLTCLKGNHDDMFLRIVAGDRVLRKDYLEQYGHSMENLLQRDSGALSDWLTGLASSSRDSDAGYACFHGSPRDPLDGYVYPDSALDLPGDTAARFVFLGHTHHRMFRTCAGMHFVNPGSLGQPRGGPPSYAVVDTSRGEVVFRDVDFDRGALREHIRGMGDRGAYLDVVLDRW
jgi:predicted phosphodiesterase